MRPGYQTAYIASKYKNLLFKALLLLLPLLPATLAKAQTQAFTYTQYMDNLTPLNPAYSLLDKAGSADMLSRKEWAGIDGAPTTFIFNGNIPIASVDASAGLIVLNDAFAIERQTQVNAYFAKGIQLSQQEYLGVSLNAGINNYVARYSMLDASDPLFANDVKETKPNVGFGAMYYTSWYYIGVSVPELTVTSLGTASIQSNSNFVNHYYLAGALLTDVSDGIMFKPSMLLSLAKGVPAAVNVSGIFYLQQKLGLGLSYRTANNQMAGIITVNADSFHIGYSYQFGVSSNNLGGVNIPTHEVTLGYRFGKGSGKAKIL